MNGFDSRDRWGTASLRWAGTATVAAMERPVSGKWFEELTEGLVIHHVIRRTITEADNVGFTTMTMNPAWLHLDAASAAKETEFGRPLVNSLLTLSLAVGISVHETTLGTTVANLGFEESVFPAPVFHGDTIRVETEVLKRRPSSSRPGQGVVTFEHRVFNQDEVLVCRTVRNALMHRRPGGV